MDPANEGKFEPVMKRCHACAEREMRINENRSSSGVGDSGGKYFGVRRIDE